MISLVGRELFVSSDGVLRDMYTYIYIYIYDTYTFYWRSNSVIQRKFSETSGRFLGKFSFLVRSNFLFVPTSKRFLTREAMKTLFPKRKFENFAPLF